ncbi:MAG: hypothetical protein LBS84_07360 [Clostridiales bacterium]|jgi:hypothetical protein|nr:hypothetical protein [Clostridiales bacterium]
MKKRYWLSVMIIIATVFILTLAEKAYAYFTSFDSAEAVISFELVLPLPTSIITLTSPSGVEVSISSSALEAVP